MCNYLMISKSQWAYMIDLMVGLNLWPLTSRLRRATWWSLSLITPILGMLVNSVLKRQNQIPYMMQSNPQVNDYELHDIMIFLRTKRNSIMKTKENDNHITWGISMRHFNFFYSLSSEWEVNEHNNIYQNNRS